MLEEGNSAQSVNGFGVAAPTQRQCARMLAARERLIALRTNRIDQLLRFCAYLRSYLSEFIGTMDPITGSRFAEVSADGNKARGELSVTATFLTGSKLMLGTDTLANFTLATDPENLLGESVRILDVVVATDLTRAQLVVDVIGPQPIRGTVEVCDILDELIEITAQALEAAVFEAPPADATGPGTADDAPAIAAT